MIVGVALDLQIHEPDRVPGAAGGLRHELEAQRLEPQENVRVEQGAGMNEENLHRCLRRIRLRPFESTLETGTTRPPTPGQCQCRWSE